MKGKRLVIATMEVAGLWISGVFHVMSFSPSYKMQHPWRSKLATQKVAKWPSSVCFLQTRPSDNIGGKNMNKKVLDVFEESNKVILQGGSLITCALDENIERVTVLMKTEGRPLIADIDSWHGPKNTPQKFSVHIEDGGKRPFRAILETPGSCNALSFRNTAGPEYPLTAGVVVHKVGESNAPCLSTDYVVVQGKAVHTVEFASSAQSVLVSLYTRGRPLNALIELLQGPNNSKQLMEVYTEDGLQRPMNIIVETPGEGNVIRVVNQGSIEFPFSVAAEPYLIENAVENELTMNWNDGLSSEVSKTAKSSSQQISNPLPGASKTKQQTSSDTSYLDSLSEPRRKNMASYLTSLSGPDNFDTLQKVTSYLDSLSNKPTATATTAANATTAAFVQVNDFDDPEFDKYSSLLDAEIESALFSTVDSIFSERKLVRLLSETLAETKIRVQDQLQNSAAEQAWAEAKIAMMEEKLEEEKKKIEHQFGQDPNDFPTEYVRQHCLISFHSFSSSHFFLIHNYISRHTTFRILSRQK